MSISIPSDALGNCDPLHPYFESEIPNIIETILIESDNNFVYARELDYNDVQRFSTTQELITHLGEFANNALSP